MKFKKLSILFILMLALSTFFSSSAFAENIDNPNLVALGDSITYGLNLESSNSQPSPNAFPNLIQNGNFKVTNLGVPALTSTQLLNNLSNPAVQGAIGNANVITLFIGSNDLLQDPLLASVMQQLGAAPPFEGNPALEQIFNAAVQAAEPPKALIKTNLTGIFNVIQQINPNAQVILYNLYNPFGTGNLKVLGDKILNDINTNIINVIAKDNGAVVADSFSAINGNQATLILPGDIHPNKAGQIALAQAGDRALVVLKPEIELNPATTEQTAGPLTIEVATTAKKVIELKWLSGEKTITDFATAGDIITDNKFNVSENGSYTVFLFDNLGFKVVKTFKIENIKKVEPPKENPDLNTGGIDNTPTPTIPETPAIPETPETPATPVTPTTPETPAIPVTPATPVTPVKVLTDKGHALPNTASPAYNFTAIGSIVLLAGLATLKLQRRRRHEI
ncbi:GDSL-type esterase/lipase family protein [Neobacillus niacini]|uniref:GDSL-type esterase/lipase family protein n=1 Tax=Neobacillus niacini TaxID=86668 RepID=UPI00052FA8AC|nr:GDSL-type esterase/lipase family protein [Neobacillus niacini]KGM44634.1 hypothetical protein NP83_10355 [Neobacillus niacini]MEC1522348.1 GDSL-type esterase/lipase family protein [Neobacillus niacini]